MYYFDSKFLSQYIDQKIKLQVFVDGEWFTIADQSDLTDPVSGNAYTEFGQVHRFDYRNIQQIKAGENVLSLDQLQAIKSGKPGTDEKEPAANADSGGEEEEIPEEEPSKEKEPDLSWYSPIYNVGRDLLRERKRNNDKC